MSGAKHTHTHTLTARPALSMFEPSTTGREHPDYRRRHSSQLPPSPLDTVHRRLSRVSGSFFPGSTEDDGDQSSDDEATVEDFEPRANFLGRVQSYSKLMHAHTKSQLDSPSNSTLPSYARTMHAFTLNQLKHHEIAAKMATNSPQLRARNRQVMLPLKVCSDLGELSLDELPHGPSNTPVHGHMIDPVRMRKRRSVTDPIPRDFAMTVQSREFAMA